MWPCKRSHRRCGANWDCVDTTPVSIIEAVCESSMIKRKVLAMLDMNGLLRDNGFILGEVITLRRQIMLIRASLENWMSFREKTEFSMIATRERQHKERVPWLQEYRTHVLPIAAIYGGNASGKTNFCKALGFAKSLVVKGTRPDGIIAVEPFKLESGALERPTRFAFEILVGGEIYELSFSVNRREVLEERLVTIGSTKEKVLYHRHDGHIYFDKSFDRDQSFLEFVYRGTRDNQLFLTNCVSQKVNTFRPIYDWFKESLELIAPDSRFVPFEQYLDEQHPLCFTMNAVLPQLDTGITQMGGEEIPFENLPGPEALKEKLREDLEEGMTFRIPSERFVVTRRDGELVARKLVTYHQNENGESVPFDITQESDGSQRVVELLPAFLHLSRPKSEKVYVIDEIDRSMHSLLTRQLVEMYLSNCSCETRSQLLFTTHDLLLMDQQIFRRDEIWVAERDGAGTSNLIPFSDYKDVRYDKDIRKSYIQGRLGGIPRILLGSTIVRSHRDDL